MFKSNLKHIILFAISMCILSRPLQAYANESASFHSDDRMEVQVIANVESSFEIKVPKSVSLNKTSENSYEATYAVYIKGAIAENECVNIKPKYTLSMQSEGRKDSIAAISQEKISWIQSDINKNEYVQATGIIKLSCAEAGYWAGILTFDVEIEEMEEPGLYDENGNLVVSWKELTETYEMDVSKHYGYSIENPEDGKPYKIFNENSFTGKLVLPYDITILPNCVFLYCRTLTGITLSPNTEEIGVSTFQECRGLETITIPGGVTRIAGIAFYYCVNLKEVVMPAKVTEIGGRAFPQCWSLETITIPASVTSIGNNAFAGCRNLKEINFTGTKEQWDNIIFGEDVFTETPDDMVINFEYVLQE